MLQVTYGDLERLHKALDSIDDGRALAHAAKNSLNTSAFATRREWEVEGRKSMIVRNSWAFRARIPKARGGGLGHAVIKARLRKNVHEMEAVSGNTHRFMEMQERGFAKSRSGGLQIPLSKSRIGGSKRRVVQKAHWRKGGHMKFAKRSLKYRNGKIVGAARSAHQHMSHRGGRTGYISRALGSGYADSKKRYIAAAIREAREAGATHVFLQFSPSERGIYDIRTKTKLKKVWNMGRRRTRTKAHPMLQRTIKKLTPDFKTYHRSSLEYQIRLLLKRRKFRVRGTNLVAEVARFRGQ